MSIRFTLDGTTDLPTVNVRLKGSGVEGIAGFTSIATTAAIDTAGILIDDPAGTLNLQGLHAFWVDEDDCNPSRIWTGFIESKRLSRGPSRTTVGRVWDCDLVGYNAGAGFRVLSDRDSAKRPAETNLARIAWLLTTTAVAGPPIGASTLFADNGDVNDSNPRPFGEADYRGQYPRDVLDDISGVIGRNWYVFWDPSVSGPSLFYNSHDIGLSDSTLRISNVLSDASAVTFNPFIDAELTRSPEEVYSAVYLTYRNGAIFREDVATAVAFIDRHASITNDRIGLLSTAEAYADDFLTTHSAERDTITCTVEIPDTQVNLLREGMRVQIKFSHLPGYETFSWSIVRARTVTTRDNDPDTYDVRLELSTAPVPGTSGGDPGGFPHVAGCAAGSGAFVQVSTSRVTISGVDSDVLPAAPTLGNTLVRYASKRATPAGPVEPDDPDWTLTTSGLFSVAFTSDGAKVWYRLVTGSDTDHIAVTPSTGNSVDVVVELAGALTFDSSSENAYAGPTGGVIVAPARTPPTGSLAVVMGFVMAGENTGTGALFTPGSGWTDLFDDSDGSGHPQNNVLYQLVASASGSYSPTTTFAYPAADWSAESVAFICDASTNPPMPGQWVYGEVITMAGANGTTAFPFADGSLTVYVDLLDQTGAVTAQDGAAGTFTLGFTPTTGESVTVDYQGR